jgi:hypothetical protein
MILKRYSAIPYSLPHDEVVAALGLGLSGESILLPATRLFARLIKPQMT